MPQNPYDAYAEHCAANHDNGDGRQLLNQLGNVTGIAQLQATDHPDHAVDQERYHAARQRTGKPFEEIEGKEGEASELPAKVEQRDKWQRSDCAEKRALKERGRSHASAPSLPRITCYSRVPALALASMLVVVDISLYVRKDRFGKLSLVAEDQRHGSCIYER
jgi:hypothetical protein